MRKFDRSWDIIEMRDGYCWKQLSVSLLCFYILWAEIFFQNISLRMLIYWTKCTLKPLKTNTVYLSRTEDRFTYFRMINQYLHPGRYACGYYKNVISLSLSFPATAQTQCVCSIHLGFSCNLYGIWQEGGRDVNIKFMLIMCHEAKSWTLHHPWHCEEFRMYTVISKAINGKK